MVDSEEGGGSLLRAKMEGWRKEYSVGVSGVEEEKCLIGNQESVFLHIL